MRSTAVSSFTEWGKLEEVVVGDFRNFTVPLRVDDAEVSFRTFYHDNIFREVQVDRKRRLNMYAHDVRKYPEAIEEERAEDVDNLASILTDMGITVRRPESLDSILEVKTPNWTNVATPCGNVRDQFLVVGQEIIETAPVVRGRYFENDLLKPLLLEYFKGGARWTVAPRPRMLETSFDLFYVAPLSASESDSDCFEIMFDGAQCLRLGRDILFNVSNRNHELGATWLQRHLGATFVVHPVRVTDSHLDGMFLPLRPGIIIAHRNMLPLMERLPGSMPKWDVVLFEDDERPRSDDWAVMLASHNINMNVLSVDENRVIINEGAMKTIRNLERAGFTPIPIRLRHSRLYSGGFHCSTLDIRRKDSADSFI